MTQANTLSPPRILLGIDAGGTFTDFVCAEFEDSGEVSIRIHKTLSSPAAPEQAILRGIREMGLQAALDSGALMMVFQVAGASFETADARDLNDWHLKLNQAWRNLADERLAVWHHIVRREVPPEPSRGHRSAFAAGLAAA